MVCVVHGLNHPWSAVKTRALGQDQIVVLEDGRVAKAGSHAELLETGGR
jgi:ABC-type multidrug transport system fused ATPase/permease subunit